jgi:hypothetical protein
MPRQLTIAAMLATATVGFIPTVTAQDRSSVSATELNAAVTARPSVTAEAVREILSGEQATKLAGAMGVSAEELGVRVDALDGAALDRLAEQVGITESMVMQRRANVVISTTAIIIILLVLILITD